MPALVDLAGLFSVWFAWAILVGLLYAYRYSLGALLRALIALLKTVHFHIPGVGTIYPLGFLANALHFLDSGMQGYIEAGITWSETAGIYFLQGTADLAAWTAYEIEAGFGDTLGALKRLHEIHLPNIRKWVKKHVKAAILGALLVVYHYVAHALHPYDVRLKHLAHRITVVANDLKHWTGFTAKQLSRLLKLLKRLSYLGSFTGVLALGAAILRKLNLAWLRQYASAAALVGAALAVLGLSWTRCERVGRTGKKMCGLDSDWLDLLLLETTLVAGAVSLREFTHDVQDITEPAVAIMRGFIREF